MEHSPSPHCPPDPHCGGSDAFARWPLPTGPWPRSYLANSAIDNRALTNRDWSGATYDDIDCNRQPHHSPVHHRSHLNTAYLNRDVLAVDNHRRTKNAAADMAMCLRDFLSTLVTDSDGMTP